MMRMSWETTRGIARFTLIAVLTLSASRGGAAPKPAGSPDAAAPSAGCPTDVENVVRGHAFLNGLFCADGDDLKRGAQGASPLPGGCFADSYGVSCGERHFSLEVVPGKPLPAVPAGLLRADEVALAKYRLADEKLESAPEEARAAMDVALARAPTIPQFWRLRGLAQVMLGQLDLARRDLDRALALAPRSPRYRLEHAEIRARSGEHLAATAELRALEKDVGPKWNRWSELLGVLTSQLEQAKDPAAPGYRKRACAAGVKPLCAAATVPDGGRDR
jgi:tetratricopeptide (TPR) repeat protein